jgi:hypothetical protein
MVATRVASRKYSAIASLTPPRAPAGDGPSFGAPGELGTPSIVAGKRQLSLSPVIAIRPPDLSATSDGNGAVAFTLRGKDLD